MGSFLAIAGSAACAEAAESAVCAISFGQCDQEDPYMVSFEAVSSVVVNSVASSEAVGSVASFEVVGSAACFEVVESAICVKSTWAGVHNCDCNLGLCGCSFAASKTNSNDWLEYLSAVQAHGFRLCFCSLQPFLEMRDVPDLEPVV